MSKQRPMGNNLLEKLGSMLSDEEMAHLQNSFHDVFLERMQQEKQEKDCLKVDYTIEGIHTCTAMVMRLFLTHCCRI